MGRHVFQENMSLKMTCLMRAYALKRSWFVGGNVLWEVKRTPLR